MKNLSIAIRAHISFERIADLLDTAGRGAGYWAGSDLEYQSCVDKILKGENVIVWDREDDSEKGTCSGVKHILNLQKIKKGFTIMAKKYPKDFADFISEDYDNDTGDTFLQCCLFGEVIYG